MRPERVRSWQAAALLALLANVHRDPRRGRRLRIEDFDPYATPSRQGGLPLTRATIQAVRKMIASDRRCGKP